MVFIEKAQQRVTENQELESFSSEVRQQLKQFKRLAQTAVGLRAILQKKGVILAPVKFGFPQEWIARQVDSLKQTNRQLRLRLKTHIHNLINDAHQLMARDGLSAAVREGLIFVETAMQENLEHLKAGGSIDALPHDFESLEMTAVPQSPMMEPAAALPERVGVKVTAAVKDVVAGSTSSLSSDKSGLGFWEKLQQWLSTPWKTRWKDLDK